MKELDAVASIYTREIQNINHAQALAASLVKLRQCDLLCDVKLLCGKTIINAHKVVLAASSEYFQAMFTSGMCETVNTEIPMKDVDTEAVTLLINYAYTGVLLINELSVQTLLETADLLQFHTAKSLCCDFIKEQLSSDNCLDVYQLADMFNCAEVLSLSQMMFNKNWKHIVNSDAFLKLEYEVLLKLVQSDSLHVPREADVLMIILKWAEKNYHERKSLFFKLMQHIRWAYVKPGHLQDIILHQKLVKDNPQILATLKSFVSPDLKMLCPVNMRKSYEAWMYILGGEQSFLMELKSCEFFNHGTVGWDYGFSLQGPRTSFAAVTHCEKLYVIGGMRFGEKLKIVECYDRKQGRWRRLASLKKCQGDVEAAVVDDVVYVAGGSSEGEPACRYVEKYDESNNQWQAVANMKSRRRRFSLCEYKSKLYAFGGFQDSLGELKSCEMYDPDSNTWENIEPMKTNRCDLGIAVLSGYIYIAGGVNSYTGSMSTVERYDPSTNKWHTCKSLQQARGGHAMLSYFGRIVAIGGMNSYMQTCKDAEWYNEVTDEWSYLPCTNMPRFGGVAIVLPFCRKPRTYTEEDARTSKIKHLSHPLES